MSIVEYTTTITLATVRNMKRSKLEEYLLLFANKSVSDEAEIDRLKAELYLRTREREPIEFEATFVKHDNHWHPLYSLDYGFPCQKYKTARFKCVQILEEEE